VKKKAKRNISTKITIWKYHPSRNVKCNAKASVTNFKAQKTECIITNRTIFHCMKILYARNSSLTRIVLFVGAISGLNKYQKFFEACVKYDSLRESYKCNT
jgi:hypothetical protein